MQAPWDLPYDDPIHQAWLKQTKTPEQLKKEGRRFLTRAVRYIMNLQIAGKIPV